jgi:hypothetical protein
MPLIARRDAFRDERYFKRLTRGVNDRSGDPGILARFNLFEEE